MCFIIFSEIKKGAVIMKTDKKQINILTRKDTLYGQQNIDSDFILPDYYADINKILKCTIKPFNEAVNCSTDKISVAGIAFVSLLYMGDDKKLYNYESEIKYSKVLQANEIEANDNILVQQSVESSNFRALGPKRIEFRANIMISVNISVNITGLAFPPVLPIATPISASRAFSLPFL